MRKQILFILAALILALGGLALLLGSIPVPAQASPPPTPIAPAYTGPTGELKEQEPTTLHAADVVAQADGVYTWTQATRADWEAGTVNWLDSATVSGSLQLMQRLFGASTTVTPREDLAYGQTDPDIAVDASGNTYAVWEDARDGQVDIYFAYRAAVSTTWSANVKVNDDGGAAGWSGPAIAVDSNSNAYAVWEDERNGHTDIYFAYRAAVSTTWSANVKVNDDSGIAGQSGPAIAIDSNSNAYAVWSDGRNGNGDIYFASRPAGGSWGANVKVNDDSGTAGQGRPAMAVDSNGNAYAIWMDSRDGSWEIYFATCPAGGNWGANVKVNDHTAAYGQYYPAIAIDDNGNAYAVWEEVVDVPPNLHFDVYFAYRPVGGDWGTNVKLNDEESASSPDIAVDSGGNAYAVWRESQDVIFANRPAGGGWGASVRVNDDPGDANQSWPAITAGPSGNAYAVWQDERNGNSDIYFAYRPAGNTWGENVQVNDDVSGLASQDWPVIAVVPDGNAYAVWKDTRNGHGDIYFAHRPVEGDWGTNVQVNDDSGMALQSWPAIAVDASGNAYAVWNDRRNGDEDVYFAYRPASGSWEANVKVNDDAGGAWQFFPAIAVDASGNAYAAWTDERDGDDDVYFAHRPAGGSWGANVRVNDTPGAAFGYSGPAIAVDTNGNAYVLWGDERNGDYDIYFAYRAAISTTWSTNVRVNDDTGTASQYVPCIAVDADGNAYAAWSDGRNGDTDIYFAYRSAGGSWETNTKVNDDSGTADQGSLAIALDPSGNTYAVWIDSRNGDNDIYFATRPAGDGWGTNVRVNDDPGTARQDAARIAVDGTGNAYAVWLDHSYDANSYGAIHVRFARSLTTPEYATEGSYTSPELNTGVTAATWESLTWQGTTPSGTSLAFETRSHVAGGSWSEWESVGSPIVSPVGQYLQYRVTFSTTFTNTTPRLDQVQVVYRSVGTPSAPRFATPCGVTNQTTPTLRGSATAGSVVHLYVDSSEITTTTASTDGTFTFMPELSTGSHTMTATAENSNGTGSASVPLALTVDPSLLYDPINVRAGQWSKDGWLMSVPRDANGCADPDNDWQVWPRADQKFRVEVPVSYTTSAAVTVTVGTATITLTEEITGSFAGIFQPPIQAGDFTIEVNADGSKTTVDGGPVLIDPDGVVYEASGTISDTIPGVQVTCYYWDNHSGQWLMWDAWTYSQVNPQITLDDGYYSFYTPPGTYRVVAEKEGYPTYTSPDLVVESTPVRHNIPLGWRIYLPVVLRDH